MTNHDGVFDAPASNVRSQKATSEGVAGGVGVHDLVVSQHMHREGLHALECIRGHEDRRLRTLCDDDDTWTGRLFGEGGECFDHRMQVLGVRNPRRGRPRFRFALVSYDDITERKCLRERTAKELSNKWRRDVQCEYLDRKVLAFGKEDRQDQGEPCRRPKPFELA